MARQLIDYMLLESATNEELGNLEEDVCVMLCVNLLRSYHEIFLVKQPCMNFDNTGLKYLMEVLNGNATRCQYLFRMDKHVFHKLCHTLKSYGLQSTRGYN